MQSEDEWLKNRKNKIFKFLRNHQIPITESEIPIIGLVLSGGGFRASICSLAVIMALERLGLWNLISYVSSLSGSSWLLANYLVYPENLFKLKHRLRQSLSRKVFSTEDLRIGCGIVLKQHYQNLPLAVPVNFWGSCIANIMLGDILNPSDLMNQGLSSCQTKLTTGNYPFPIFTAVSRKDNEFQWYEFNPFFFRPCYSSNFIPVQHCNSHRKHDKIIETCSEPSWPQLFGIFGSAFSANFNDIFRHFNNHHLLTFISPLIYHYRMQNWNLPEAHILNPFSSLSNDKFLPLIDAGIHFNFPILPITERHPDIIILANFSSQNQPDIHTMLNYLSKFNYPFPPLSNCDLQQPHIFYPLPNSSQPLLIYLPNQKHYSTFKLQYSFSEFDDLFDHMYQTVLDFGSQLRSALSFFHIDL